MALWIYDRANAVVSLQPQLARLRACDAYELLDDREAQNRLVKFVMEDRRPVLVPVRPRQFARAVAQQSILTVSPDIGTGRSASQLVDSWKASHPDQATGRMETADASRLPEHGPVQGQSVQGPRQPRQKRQPGLHG
jgi:hypothetical protein